MKKQDSFTWPGIHGPWENLSAPFKLSFLSAGVLGLITHIYLFTNLLLNHDSCWRLYYDNNNTHLGRWAVKWFSDLSTQFQTPVVIGVISILALALTAALTIETLEITNKFTVIFASGFIAIFPSVTSILSYLFTADAFLISLLLNALAAYCAKKYRYGWIVSIALCTVACGIYQAFICYTIGLLLMDCIQKLLAEVPVRKVLVTGLKYISVILASLVFYYLIVKLALLIEGKELSSYQGISSMSMGNIKEFILEIPLAYRKYITYFTDTPYLSEFFQIIQHAFFAVSAGALIYYVVAVGVYKDVARLGLLLVGLAMIPLALNFITVLALGSWVHALMIYSFVLQFVFALKIVEMTLQRLVISGNSNWPIVSVANILLSSLMLWNCFCIDNIAYLRLQVCYENSFALANRIAVRIEELDGYSSELPVAVIGEASLELYGRTGKEFAQIDSMTGTNDWLLYSPEPHIRTRTFIEDYIGLRMPQPDKAQLELLNNSEIINEMPSYPTAGSIVIYEGIIVVKLSDGTIR